MIADTTFLSDLHHERENGLRGLAGQFLSEHRSEQLLVTVISAGELAVIFSRAGHLSGPGFATSLTK